jgi:hypothetical protein
MRFEFTFGSDDQLEVRGTPVGNPQVGLFRRSGKYRFKGSQLISEAVNQGQAVEVRLAGSHLLLKFGGELTFHLKRKKPVPERDVSALRNQPTH